MRRLKSASKSRPRGRAGRSPAENRLHEELEEQRLALESKDEELRDARHEGAVNLRRYVELFDVAPIGYALLDAHEAVVNVNHMGAKILGVPRAYLQGAKFTKLMLPGDRALLGKVIAKSVATAKPEVAEVRFGNKEELRYLRLTVTMGAEHGTAMVAFEDVTDRKTWETRMAQTETALREADRRKDEYLAMLSHELRNPLAPMRSSLYALRHVELRSDQASDAMNILERQVEHLARLLTDLLDVTRIARGKVHLERQRIQLGELVRRAIDDYRADFRAKGLTLDARVGDVPLWVDGDATRIAQAISNLLSNAEKFTPPGGRVVVTLAEQNGHAALSVHDNGVGIASELLGQLFTPFLQGPQSMARSGGGLGLGLAMVKGMVELHGGSVSAASEGHNCGTEVTIRLPLAPPPARGAGAHDRPAAPQRRRVLVIDDNADGANSIRLVLELAGHDVSVALDGEKGILLALTNRPDVVVCDLGLPRVDGYAVARALRAEPAGKKMLLLAVSGYARAEDVKRALEAGFDRHFAKPADPAELERTIRAAFPRRPATTKRRAEAVA